MYSIVIQAGGNSTRMGTDKSFVKLCGKPIIKFVIESVSSLGDEIIVTTNNPSNFKAFNLRTIRDYYPNYGALAGLHAGIKASKNDLVIVVANDMPFINSSLINYMKTLMVADVDLVIPFQNGSYEPFCAIYRQSTCLPAIQNAISMHLKRIISWFDMVHVLTITEKTIEKYDPEKFAFYNINTKEELKIAEEIVYNHRDRFL
jgi:molybdopterin-guanine dinucleotide biosynthesis protein A